MPTKSAVLERTDVKVREPKRYSVIMLNDDFTTMEFVVSVLIDIFHKDRGSAEAIMLKVHHEGKAVVGLYSYDIAVTRVNKALARAKAENFPFRMTIEEG